jgi:DNA-binding LacI/PurR family transcriptional regulator
MEMASWEGISLTTIKQPIKQIVTSSVELIAAMLEEPDRYPEARLFPCRVVERATLRPKSPIT